MISDSTSLIPTEGRVVGRRELLLLHTNQADYLSTGLNTLAKPQYSCARLAECLCMCLCLHVCVCVCMHKCVSVYVVVLYCVCIGLHSTELSLTI